MRSDIILIGMAGCGKSTVGVLLAKTLGCGFTDTDLTIQSMEKMLLQDIINKKGLEYFKSAEDRALCSINEENTVIATGGSAVYCEHGMEHLKGLGICVWLKVPFPEICRRINNISTRGIAIAPGKTLEDIYYEREPLYRRYADIIINSNGDAEQNVSAIFDELSAYGITPH